MPYTEKGSPYASGENGDTSHAAATHADETREHRGRMYLKLLYSRGPLTDHQARYALGLPLSSINSTRNAVMVYALVERGDEQRITEYGEKAWTWRLTHAGRASVVAMLPPIASAPDAAEGVQGHDTNTAQPGRLL